MTNKEQDAKAEYVAKINIALINLIDYLRNDSASYKFQLELKQKELEDKEKEFERGMEASRELKEAIRSQLHAADLKIVELNDLIKTQEHEIRSLRIKLGKQSNKRK